MLDTFTRANGAPGANWGGATSSFQIAGNQLDVVNTGDAGPLLWSPTSFGATQQACVKFAAIDANADDIALILKAQSSSGLGNGLMEVLYDPTPGAIRIWTYDTTNDWVKRGTDLSATFAAGDTLRVVAHVNGQVEIYKNTTLLGMRDASAWTYSAQGGYIGLWSLNGPSTLFDDFGGGTYSGSASPAQLAAAPGGAAKSLHLEVPDSAARRAAAERRLAAVEAWASAWGVASTEPADSESASGLFAPVNDAALTASAAVTPVSPNAGEVFRLYVSAGARPVAVRTVVAGGSSSVQYLHPDHLGSIGQITDSARNWVQDLYFKPYGGVRWSAEPGGTGPDTDAATRRSYTGQYEETSQWMGSLMHYKARYYSPFLHRFTQPDTIVPGAGNPQNLNRYSYVRGNPTGATDPTGHVPDPACAGRSIADCGVDDWYGSIASENQAVVQGLLDTARENWFDFLGQASVLVGSIIFEPVDWAITGYDCVTGNCSPLALAGLLPIIPAHLGNRVDDLASVSSQIARTSQSLPDDAIVFQYQRNMPKPGREPVFSNLPRPGEAAISCQYGPACGNNPIQGLGQAFGRAPNSGEYYRQTTIGQIRSSGRVPDFDGGLIVDGRQMPVGHLSIYGTDNVELFAGIWSNAIPLR